MEGTPLLETSRSFTFERLTRRWWPDPKNDDGTPRSLRKRLFLLLTEPETSILSAILFWVLVILISSMNLVMMMQTMPRFQSTPKDCRTCGGPTSYLFDDDDSIVSTSNQHCVCPPTPFAWTGHFLDGTIYFFTVEWLLRVATFEPVSTHCWQSLGEWLSFVTSWTTVLDFWAIFPYYMELTFHTNGLMSLRLLRLFRVFQLVRLGQYNTTFQALTAVLFQSLLYLKLLLVVLVFGAAFFGSMLYWLEKGDWKYYEPTQSYQFVRPDGRGGEEISPFESIPETFWWFIVTATTVGYGDTVPNTTGGRWVAAMAMLTGVLVIAFPVSIFSDLWQKELKKTGFLEHLEEESDEDQEENNNNTHIYHEKLDPMASVDSMATYGSSTRRIVGDNVLISKNDLAELYRHMETMHDSQRSIRRILKQYKLA